MEPFVLWIWPSKRDKEKEDKIRNILRSRSIEWIETIEECMSEPITLDTGFEDLTPDNIEERISDYTVTPDGELLFCGMTELEFNEKFNKIFPGARR